MKIYLVDEYQIYSYSLPNKVEDAFVITYVHYSGKEESLTFKAEDGKWAIQSNSEIQFMNESLDVDKDFIEDNSTYTQKAWMPGEC